MILLGMYFATVMTAAVPLKIISSENEVAIISEYVTEIIMTSYSGFYSYGENIDE